MKILKFGIGIIAVSVLIFLVPLSVSAVNTGVANNSCTGNGSLTYNMMDRTVQSMMGNDSYYRQNMMENIRNISMMNPNTIENNMFTMMQGVLGYKDISGVANSIVEWYHGM